MTSFSWTSTGLGPDHASVAPAGRQSRRSADPRRLSDPTADRPAAEGDLPALRRGPDAGRALLGWVEFPSVPFANRPFTLPDRHLDGGRMGEQHGLGMGERMGIVEQIG